MAFSSEWARLARRLEIRFILTPRGEPGHPLLRQIRDTAVSRCQVFKESGGYAKLGIDPILKRTGPQMALEVVERYAKARGIRYQKALLVRALNIITPENVHEHFTQRHPEILRIAGLPPQETGNT
jgi:hypothetical protein